MRLTVLWNFPWWAWARRIKLRKSHFGLKFDGWQGAVYHEADPCMKWPHSANVAFSDIGRPRVLSEHLVPALLWRITHIGLGRFTSNCPSATELQDPTSREPTKHEPEQKWAVPLVLSLDLSRSLILISSLACTIGAQKNMFCMAVLSVKCLVESSACMQMATSSLQPSCGRVPANYTLIRYRQMAI